MKILASHLTEVGFVIKEKENTIRFSSQKFDNHSVIRESYIAPANTFIGILSLFKLKDVSVEEKLKIFVCVIDTQLLQRIAWKILSKRKQISVIVGGLRKMFKRNNLLQNRRYPEVKCLEFYLNYLV